MCVSSVLFLSDIQSLQVGGSQVSLVPPVAGEGQDGRRTADPVTAEARRLGQLQGSLVTSCAFWML